MHSLQTASLLDLSAFAHARLFDGKLYPWQALPELAAYVAEQVARVPAGQRIRGRVDPGAHVAEDVVIGEGTIVDPGAVLMGPAIVGRECHVRANAYCRGVLLAGDGCILGNACEFKNAVLLDEAEVPHLSYVGDSILGRAAHLGAGVICSNFKSLRRPGDADTVKVRWDARDGTEAGAIDTGLRKLGAIVGDGAEVGCHCVLNPGTVIGRRSVLYPNLSCRGTCPEGCVVKVVQEIRVVERA